ncbi:hypothetical protein ASPZODRAFT_12074 [Penicilliopsis zonata CBS 506.65]|uniref:phospholipase D n=1 Tax=Penicilliopsis zonata CBS 506.65 TaxID=1073090 RepID=A0A1L9SVJ2_9EURO|nr:hypothetical protein ASPZODRAFT_12074 [Penicilliopsis zonata CBS 506.65]OJJ51235.1 hypothetical protein ASPZODRAFT_12074 [Penicilliopsis zonata CBS 506.65]
MSDQENPLAYGRYYENSGRGGNGESTRGFIDDTFKMLKETYKTHHSQSQQQQQQQQQQSGQASQQYSYGSGNYGNEPPQPFQQHQGQPNQYSQNYSYGSQGQQSAPGYQQPQPQYQEKPQKQDKLSGLFDKIQGAVTDLGTDVAQRLGTAIDPKAYAEYGTEKPNAQQNNRFGSFAPTREGNDVKWYVDGCNYFWAVSRAIENARESIWILDWWLSPELYLRRPPAKNEQYRLDRMLQAAAQRGVRINVIVYKEVTQALTLSSAHTKHVLEGLHPNISVFRHPDHIPDGKEIEASIASSFQNLLLDTTSLAKLPGDALKSLYGMKDDAILYWAHHEKLCLIDGAVAFMGGLDLCFGRWDTHQHSIADVHPTDLNEIVFPGQDYNNARVLDFHDVSHWENNQLDRKATSRMGWSDISVSLHGPVVEDLRRHFVQRWNFIYETKYKARNQQRYTNLVLYGRPTSSTGQQQYQQRPPQQQAAPGQQQQQQQPPQQPPAPGYQANTPSTYSGAQGAAAYQPSNPSSPHPPQSQGQGPSGYQQPYAGATPPPQSQGTPGYQQSYTGSPNPTQPQGQGASAYQQPYSGSPHPPPSQSQGPSAYTSTPPPQSQGQGASAYQQPSPHPPPSQGQGTSGYQQPYTGSPNPTQTQGTQGAAGYQQPYAGSPNPSQAQGTQGAQGASGYHQPYSGSPDLSQPHASQTYTYTGDSFPPPPPGHPSQPSAAPYQQTPTPPAQAPYFPPPPTQDQQHSQTRGIDEYYHAGGYGEGDHERGSGSGSGSSTRRFREEFTEYSSVIRSQLAGQMHHYQDRLNTYGRPQQQVRGGMTCQIVRSCSNWSHGIPTEHSIADAYAAVIRNSQHFVYIENQFFITATGDSQKPVHNQIGAAIVERILRAARAGEKYKIIVVIPSVPGFAGDLRDDSALGTRAIMEFQYNSINRGGHSIMELIAKEGFNPMDYIRFYNLRNYDRLNVSDTIHQVEQRSGVNYEEARREHDVTTGGQGGYGPGAPRAAFDTTAPYQQYQQAAQQVYGSKPVTSGRWDSVSECYMLNGEDIRNVPWDGSPEAEIHAFVSEELYIHSKVMIADDRVVICGSANLNDRSQLGDHDSEIAIVIEDFTPVHSTMNGKPFTVGRFATSLRRELFRKHLGLLPAQNYQQPTASSEPVGIPSHLDLESPESQIVADPLADTFQSLWNTRARTNTQVFNKVFHAVPDDSVRNWATYKEFYEYFFRAADKDAADGSKERHPARYQWGHVVREEFAPGPEGVQQVKEQLSQVKGTLVEMPLMFLIEEDIAKEGLSLNDLTEPIYT